METPRRADVTHIISLMDQPGADQKRQGGSRPAAGMTLVSYVLVNWNTEAFLDAALASIRDQSHKFREVILVNNGSPGADGTGFRLTSSLALQPDVYINNPRNLGFAAANNQGIAAASGDVVVLLNCDARLDPDFTSLALQTLSANPRIGSVVCKQFIDDRSGRLESTGHIMFTGRTATNRGRGEVDQGQYDQGGFVFGGNAAAIAYRREMLDQLSQRTIAAGTAEQRPEIFDESFFAYFEDVDLDWRAQLSGWLAYYEPRCVAYHHVHGSGGRGRWKIRMLAEKNRYLMLVKNDTLAGQLHSALPILAYEALHSFKVLSTPYLWPAGLLFFWHLPGALAARWLASGQRNVSSRQVQAMFRPYGLRPPPRAQTPTGETPEYSAGGAAVSGLVSIIVLNWNGLNMTRRCLDSILAQSYDQIEIVIVDNGSDTDEAELLRLDLGIAPGQTAQVGNSRIRILRLPRNQGFAGGVNWGLPLAQGDFVVLVNNDCVLDEDCIKRLVYAARLSGADAVSGRLVNIGDVELIAPAVQALRLELEEDPEDVVWDMPPRLAQALQESYRNHGTTLFGYRAGDLYPATETSQLSPGASSLKPAFYPSGGLCLISREVIDELAPELFPTLFFAYHEDNFLGNHLRATGRRIIKEPRAAAVHLHNATSRSLGKVRLRFYQERNRLMRMLIWQPASVLLRLAPVMLLQHLLGYFWTLLRQPMEWPGLMLAHLWVLFHLPTVAQLRSRYRSQMRVADEEVLSQMSGRLRGEGGFVNAITVAWCRIMGIPCYETSRTGRAAQGAAVQTPRD